MTALALILCAAIAAMGVIVIVKPSLAHDWTRLLADKTGMWITTAIRAVLALGLLAAASDSKAPMVLRMPGFIGEKPRPIVRQRRLNSYDDAHRGNGCAQN